MNRINYKKLIFTAVFISTLLFSLNLFPVQSPAGKLLAVHGNDYPTPTAIAQIKPAVPVIAERVEYGTVNDEIITGYFAYPESATEAKPLPGIIAIHEWWGLNENIKAMARRLAGEGYQVLAVDLYQGKIAESPEVASQLVAEVEKNPLSGKENLQQAYAYLIGQKQAPKIGSIGWCFGGSWSLAAALLFPQELDAAVIYYGGKIGEATVEELETINAPILGIFGADDDLIPLDTVAEFESTLDRLGKISEFHIYEDVGHAFANPSGENYVAEAAEQAWEQTRKFLAQYL